jgi:hypothetical protein
MRPLASHLLAPLVILIAASLVAPALRLHAADTTILAGRWMIDKDQSEFPAEIGFDTQVEAAGQSTTSTSGRSRRVGTAAPPLTVAHEGEQTLKMLGDVTDEAEHPWPVLTIDEADGVVTMTDGGSQVRRFHPGKDDEQRLADGGITTHTKWDKNALVIDYTVEKDRDVRYTYSRASDAPSLMVEVSFRDHGHGDTVKRIYVAAK